jgi:hypothetical protein
MNQKGQSVKLQITYPDGAIETTSHSTYTEAERRIRITKNRSGAKDLKVKISITH